MQPNEMKKPETPVTGTTPIQPDKVWAKDMTQEQFDREFTRRNPGCDVIPDLSDWLYRPIERYRTKLITISNG